MEQRQERPLDDEIALLEEHLRLIRDRADRALEWFYATLFVTYPHLRPMFPAAMDVQRDRFFRALTGAVRNIGDTETFAPMLRQLGRDHRKYGVRPEHYECIGYSLVVALAKVSEGIWVPELEAAWWRAYNYMATTMISGAQEAAAQEPAWWKGEIIAHERRVDDIAVITVKTDRPYPYTAGQFASIETPYRPRSWRTYSMATAPSPDGLLEFHIRALSSGWVSGPLVWRAMVGDTLKLGAAMGEMTVDKASNRDIVCIAGGTGLAPIKAIVDDLTKWNTSRQVHVFFGVRRPSEFYDMAPLLRMAAAYPWLNVITSVSEEPLFSGETGLLPDVVARYGTWRDHDAFICGSPDMVRATAAKLGELGVPRERMHYDVAGDVHPLAEVIDLRKTRQSRAWSNTPGPGNRW